MVKPIIAFCVDKISKCMADDWVANETRDKRKTAAPCQDDNNHSNKDNDNDSVKIIMGY